MIQFYDRNFFYYFLELIFYCGWSVVMTGIAVTLVKVGYLEQTFL